MPLGINRKITFQTFKYSVYTLLLMNVYFFFAEEWAASIHRFVDGVGLADIIEGFAASIDTAAWLLLLLLFELETYVLDDRHFTKRIVWSLHGIRIFCYVFIVYAFYGYLVKLIFLFGSAGMPGVNELCVLVDGRWAYAVDLDEYVTLTLANCASFSPATSFVRFPELFTIVDQTGFTDILRLAWVDVINAAVWLLIVLMLEIDVRMAESGRAEGVAQRSSNRIKVILYATLLMAAAYWGVKGDFVDFWDALLWLVAFAFIERNIFEWRHETLDEANLKAQHIQ